jgi:hypothetical protein
MREELVDVFRVFVQDAEGRFEEFFSPILLVERRFHDRFRGTRAARASERGQQHKTAHAKTQPDSIVRSHLHNGVADAYASQAPGSHDSRASTAPTAWDFTQAFARAFHAACVCQRAL